MPEIALVLGSHALADEVKNPTYVPYGEIPHFKVSTAPDHAGRMVCGTLAGRRVICMQGRLHGYEGYAPDEVAYPVYVMKALGVKALVVTNASGGINTGYHAGDFMLITDHINMTGKSPLTGKNDLELGTRFPDMTFAYSHELGEKAMQAAANCGLKLHQGVYCGVNGPQFETPAEIRMFRTLGADAVGMSTVFEVIAAAHCGLPLVGIAMITNMAAGVLMQPLLGAEVNETAERRGAELRRLVAKLLEKKFKENFKSVDRKRFLRYTNKACHGKRWQLDFEVWLSLVERFVRDEEAAGSNPVTSTTFSNQITTFRGVAQLGRALRSGRRGRRFKSCHLDHKNSENHMVFGVFCYLMKILLTT